MQRGAGGWPGTVRTATRSRTQREEPSSATHVGGSDQRGAKSGHSRGRGPGSAGWVLGLSVAGLAAGETRRGELGSQQQGAGAPLRAAPAEADAGPQSKGWPAPVSGSGLQGGLTSAGWVCSSFLGKASLEQAGHCVFQGETDTQNALLRWVTPRRPATRLKPELRPQCRSPWRSGARLPACRVCTTRKAATGSRAGAPTPGLGRGTQGPKLHLGHHTHTPSRSFILELGFAGPWLSSRWAIRAA